MPERAQIQRCAVDGHEYRIDSFADFVHQFIELNFDVSELRMNESLQRIFGMIWGIDFHEGLIWELGIHFSKFIQDYTETDVARSPEYRNWILKKWNPIGLSLINSHQLEYAERLFAGLLDIQRKLQSSSGWVPKGTAYYHIGLARFMGGKIESRRDAEPYFIAAHVEDVLYEVNGLASIGNFKTLPAYRMLKFQYRRPDEYFQNIRAIIERAYDNRQSMIGKLHIENAELLVLEEILRMATHE